MAWPVVAVAMAGGSGVLLAVEEESKSAFDFVGPIAGTGLVGVILLMLIFRFRIMPTYVHDDAKKAWDDERTRLLGENEDLKSALRSANDVYTTQVIPTLTRVLDAERELVDLRREEQRARQYRDG